MVSTLGRELWLLLQPACCPLTDRLQQKGPRAGMPAQYMGAYQPPAHEHLPSHTLLARRILLKELE